MSKGWVQVKPAVGSSSKAWIASSEVHVPVAAKLGLVEGNGRVFGGLPNPRKEERIRLAWKMSFQRIQRSQLAEIRYIPDSDQSSSETVSPHWILYLEEWQGLCIR